MSSQLATPTRSPRFLAATLAVIAGLIVFAAPGEVRGSFKAQYESAVMLLVEHGWFELQIEDSQRRVGLVADAATGEVDPGRIALVHAIRDLREDKPILEQDLRQTGLWTLATERAISGAPVAGFQADEASAWLFESDTSWRGEIAYARRPATDIIPLARVGQQGGLALLEEAGLIGDSATPFVVTADNSGLPPQTAVDLKCEDGGEPAGRIYRIGGEVVVQTFGNQCAISVGARPLGNRNFCNDQGIPEDQCNFALVRLGDLVRFHRTDSGPELAVYQRQRPVSEAMIMRRNALQEKVTVPQFRALVDALGADIQPDLRGCSNANRNLDLRCDQDITMAIDYAMQESAERSLAAAPSPRNRRGTVVVMNALSGEVLAMAGAMERLPQDCHHPAMCTFPVGSTAKPIFATAMLASAGEANLAELVVPYKGGASDAVLGMPLGRPLNNANGAGPGSGIALGDFIANSDNYYMAALALLASPHAAGGACALLSGEWYQIGTQRFGSRRPRSAFETAQCRQIEDGIPPDFRPSWADALEDIFALDPFSLNSATRADCDDSEYLGNSYMDATPWRALMRPSVNPCAIAGAGLQRKWFGIDRQNNFRLQTVPMILGNGDGQFSAVKLAEAYSRIVSGRRVQSSFVDLRGANGASGRNFDQRTNAARIAISRGMARVLDGTAAGTSVPGAIAARQPMLEQRGLRLGVFAKTGTMQLDGVFARDCPVGADPDDCVGRAFVMVAALYPADAANGEWGPAQRAASASAQPVCAMTIAVNLPQWNLGERRNPAAEVAARIVQGPVGDALFAANGEYCAN